MVKINNKGISPVVATALLLVVAVVAVVGFQTWFNTYQSGLNAKVEQQSDTGSSITIERLGGNKTDPKIYLKNSGSSDVNATSVKLTPKDTSESFTCTSDTDGEIISANSVNTTVLSCSDGPDDGNIYNVVVVTADGVFSGEQIMR